MEEGSRRQIPAYAEFWAAISGLRRAHASTGQSDRLSQGLAPSEIMQQLHRGKLTVRVSFQYGVGYPHTDPGGVWLRGRWDPLGVWLLGVKSNTTSSKKELRLVPFGLRAPA